MWVKMSKVENEMRKSQAWSIDVMIAIVIFMATIFLFFVFLNPAQKDNVGEQLC